MNIAARIRDIGSLEAHQTGHCAAVLGPNVSFLTMIMGRCVTL